MNDGTELITKSGVAKSFGLSLVFATIITAFYTYKNQIPLRTESVWEVFFTSIGLAFIVCMAGIVVYSQFDHTPTNHTHSH